MHLPRLYSKVAVRTALAVLIAACAGCWEKIEYTGPRSTAATPPSASTPPSTSPELPTTTASPPATDPSATPQVVSVAEPPAVVAEEPPAPPSVPETVPPVATETPPPEVVGDRYATPPVVESPPTTAVAIATPPPTVTTPVTAPETTNPYATEAEPPRHNDATTTSATAETTPPADAGKPAVAINSRRAAWLLGSRLSLAALANDRGIAAKNVPIWMEDARTAAKLLGTSVADLPEPAGTSDTSLASRQVIDYLVANGQRIGPELSKQYGAEQSALFEIALKSNILLLLYSPDTSAGGSVAAAITQVAPKAKLPAQLWQPLVDVLNKKATQTEVRAAVRKMHVDIDQYLSQSAEQSGR